jgi:hypothetical protein
MPSPSGHSVVGLQQWGDDYCSEKPPMLAHKERQEARDRRACPEAQ